MTTIETPTLEAITALEALFKGMDKWFSESGERQRFIVAANELCESDQQLLQAALAGKLKAEAAHAGALAADNPLRIADALLMLETTLKKCKDRVLLDFLFTLLQAPKAVKALNRARFFPWEFSLLHNKNLTEDQVRFIWQSRQTHYAKELVPTSKRVLIKHPSCPMDVLEAELACDDGIMRKTIAWHKNTSPTITHFFLNSPRKLERLNLALSRQASSEVLLSLLADKYDEVSRAARKNLAARFPDLEITEAAIQAAIAKNVSKPFVKPATPKEAFDPWKAEEGGAASIQALDSNQRRRVASNSWNPQTLRVLAADSAKAVRRAVAKNHHSGLEVWNELVQDPDTETSNNAFERIARETPDVVAETVLSAQVIDAAYREIASHVQQNSQDDDQYERFNAQQLVVFQQMLLVVAHSNNPLIQLMIVKDLDAIPELHTVRWRLLSALADNRHLIDSVARKLVMQLQFGAVHIIERCSSVALLKEFLLPGNIDTHQHYWVEERLKRLGTRESEG